MPTQITFTRTLDISLAIAASLAMVVLVIFKGDSLYLGLWYYITVPVVILGSCAGFRPAPLFLFGIASSIAISMLTLMSVNWHAARPEGLLGLVHIFSLPGAFIAALGTVFIARKIQTTNPSVFFLLGLIGYGSGYFINQLVIFNKVM